ncbi:MAG: hypothetical protein KJ970_12580 [Candidatus Eisenbacteria bacterium]|uniref:Glycogen debranching enzyme C-terminal domain-containing protein n=1 Tax=Eiseniibacteriota bacterium TaxID=2212470 RepID=A0A948RY70_UNCEI|nr:hypothetical protein [Candidatus Eisenbacteria bacterium]MBU1950378.1 hypothetical protein [Candidatus Eisenbacteria bacterium]MBU2691754.1 hypothetical protein [Candidatus Eisenbacteria bacterium]
MDTKEHYYQDDPKIGPPDVRTDLPGIDYYFIGNGHILAAIQVCTSGSATPLGLLVMHPERFGSKRQALTMDSRDGLRPTMIRLREGRELRHPLAERVRSAWIQINDIPAVLASWSHGDLAVEERFYCPDRSSPALIREIRIVSSTGSPRDLILVTGPEKAQLEAGLQLYENTPVTLTLEYSLEELDAQTMCRTRLRKTPVKNIPAADYWNTLGTFQSSSKLLDHLFAVSRNQIAAVPAASGAMDASIWQYNREWLRDQTMVVMSRIMLGEFESSQVALRRLMNDFVSEGGDTVDSGCLRPALETELDQNGEILTALRTYVDWTGDSSIVEEFWPKIEATAEFPLRKMFRHEPSGLLHNQRDYWERHIVHGIQDGLELAHQLYVSAGLSDAARLARLMGREEKAQRWESEGRRLQRAIMMDKQYSLIDEGRFIKRRDISGSVQREIRPREGADLPSEIPLMREGPHLLDPDSASVIPIAMEFIDPKCELARCTLEQTEELWNQQWEGGGYSRYNITSEAGSPAPWPIATVRIAAAYFENGDDEKVWRALEWIGSAPGSRSGSWFEFYGPSPVPPYPQVGVIPWTWAEIVRFHIHHLLGVRPELDHLILRPRLLPGMKSMSADLRLRNFRLRLKISKAEPGERPGFTMENRYFPCSAAGVKIPWPEKDLAVTAVLD